MSNNVMQPQHAGSRTAPVRWNQALANAICWLVLSATTAAWAQTGPAPLAAELQQSLQSDLQDLQKSQALPDAVDAGIFAKGLEWALKYDREFTPADVRLLQQAVTRSRERQAELNAGRTTWSTRHGKVALGYVSRVDGSIQPYGLIIPRNYTPDKPIRLDVVLHGSTRPVGMSELRFISRFDEGDAESASAPDQPFIELHPLGRVENCYRWAGETDVFEAIDDVCRRYAIDRDRIVLRGMSMGASGTWHLGLKHPDRFVALGPYCGYVDTHRFSETPLPNFIKVGPLPEYQELGLHMLDSVDYAANAGIVPAIACMGEKDVFFQAHVIMGDAMREEGLTMVNLISPGTGHVIDPVTHAEQMRRIAEYADAGINHQPEAIRFVTWTLKYSHCHWLQLLGLEQHYARAELQAQRRGPVVEIKEPRNITAFALDPSGWTELPQQVRIGEQNLPVPEALANGKQRLILVRQDNQWTLADSLPASLAHGKRPGLQGPIDDAFAEPFLCVRGTGKPWNPAVQAYADASLNRFAQEWHHYFRGPLPIKNDTDVTDADLRNRNLILFGDPGSNPWIAKVLPDLPLEWTRDSLRMAGQNYPAADHLPALIFPNPLPGAEAHSLVINSGHTFRESELNALNYLLFPRWGDWAVISCSATQPLPETLVRAGYFDEHWQFNR